MNQPTVAVIGLGFVGLPLALSYALRGVQVIGVDVNEALVRSINEGITHHTESYGDQPIQTILTKELESGRFYATSNWEDLPSSVTAYLVTVGIPTTEDGTILSQPLLGAVSSLASHIKREDTVIIRGTVVPGFTSHEIAPRLSISGLMPGVDFHLAYASERIAEGKAFHEFEHMPLAVGGVSPACTEAAVDILTKVTKAPVTHASCMEVVEFAKVIENVQRDVNIAMVQEFARLAEAMGLDIYEIIMVANSHTRVHLLTPGPGVGGYCIPNAYHYLAPVGERLQVPLPLTSIARVINENVPHVIVEQTEALLSSIPVSLPKARVAIFGLGMKDFSSDDRLSPSVEIAKLLYDLGAEVRAFDPLVPTKYPFSVDTPEEAVKEAHVVLFLTEQPGMRTLSYHELRKQMHAEAIFIDTRNITSSVDVSMFNTVWKI
ncbi:hypothetical protein Q73_16415 [Bacillus coahuilensis m2-6]|uniref:nucleotide sugar dehydrogenase n=1 Tax=Bacillus coahuilensis TaxID=408580 RepID=UPI000750523E|nr:nucleotide sugar dehydrogenase [Bacillus coahuilensis]KUP04087.1 hypothetical protein Q73_16415 [Bacillus coahuilensis m2-6]